MDSSISSCTGAEELSALNADADETLFNLVDFAGLVPASGAFRFTLPLAAAFLVAFSCVLRSLEKDRYDDRVTRRRLFV